MVASIVLIFSYLICGWYLVVNGSFELSDSLLLASQKSGSSVLLLFTVLTHLIQFFLNTHCCLLKLHFLFTALSSSRLMLSLTMTLPFLLNIDLCSPSSSWALVARETSRKILTCKVSHTSLLGEHLIFTVESGKFRMFPQVGAAPFSVRLHPFHFFPFQWCSCFPPSLEANRLKAPLLRYNLQKQWTGRWQWRGCSLCYCNWRHLC